MPDYTVRPVDKRYNREMLDILASCPIQANGLTLSFDKSPDIFSIPGMKYTASEHLGFFTDDILKGFGSLGYYEALIQGKQETVFTFYNFYALPEIRGTKITHTAAHDFFSWVRGKSNYGVSITLKGNRATESYIGHRLYDWAPENRFADDLVVKSMLFALPKKNNTPYLVRNAREEDLPQIVTLLKQEHAHRDFGLLFSEDDFMPSLKKRGLQLEDYYVALNKKQEIIGVCLAWDCNSFRRTRVLEYNRKFYPTLLAYKALEKILPLTRFPAKGEAFRELTITDYAVVDRNPVIMHALLSEIYQRHHHRKYHFMNWASCASDPLLQAAKGFWHQNLTSNIIFASMDPGRFNISLRLPYIDIAFI
ncbi:MAG TPA: hypothetical protein VJ508_06645 [Saprospiraceae bacterium]|nr:hypothetical protein [Saprospiraceae bacterium]